MTATVLSSAIILTKAQRGVLGPEYGLFTTQLYVTPHHQMRHKSHTKVLSKLLNKEK